MATHHPHCVAVMGVHDDGGERLVWGMITDLDLARAARQGRRPGRRRPGHHAGRDDRVRRAAGRGVDLMLERGVHHLVVTGSDARPVGVVATLDVGGVMAQDRE